MTQIQKNIVKASVVIMLLFLILIIAFLINIGLSDKLINSPYNKRLKELRETTQIGSIYDTNQILLAGSVDGYRTYNSNEIMRSAHAHLIGDTYGYCPTGADISFASILLGYNESLVSTITRQIKDVERSGENIQLTVDCRLNVFAYDLLKDYSGAIVVQDYSTGEILCMVSSPVFDPETIIEDLSVNMEKDAFVNRAIQGQYVPGSLFYIVTAGAAIEYIDDIQERDFFCNGSYLVDDESIACENAHGSLSLEEAFTTSCDTVFAQLGVELGAKKLTNFAEQLKFNYDFNYSDLSLYSSNISVSTKEEDAAFAYAAIGQHEDTVSPLHMSMIAGAIANDGIMMTPNLLKSFGNKLVSQKHGLRIISNDTVKVLQEYMGNNISLNEDTSTDGYSVDICCKEGVAIASTDNSLYPNSWFLGYINDDNHPLVICVITEQSFIDENVSSAMGKSVLEYAYSIGY